MDDTKAEEEVIMSLDAVEALGKTDFLNLLATQLRYQDPMNPIENTEFIAQLAQFSALESANNTQTAVESLSRQESCLFATSLLGKTVSGVASDTQTAFNGVVTGVSLTGEAPVVYVSGQPVYLTDIQTIA